jgi:hypothetical protein
MGHLTDRQTPARPIYYVISNTTSIHDNDTELTVRSNGKLFYIHISPSHFRNSPATTAQYLAYLEVLRSGEEQIDGLFESDFYEWASWPFETLFEELAPASEQIVKVTLQDYLFPEFFVCALEAVDDKLVPRRVETQDSGHMPPGVWLGSEFRDYLNAWTASFHPSKVEVSFEQPDDALFKTPRRVLVDGGQTAYFFKAFHPGAPGSAKAELEAYRKIAEADLGPDVRICRLHGVVQDKEGLLMGMLLTYVDHQNRTLTRALWPEIPVSLRQQWASQIRETLAELHRVGIVWGDAKAENVLIDKENNAWITDFGGGYTVGWVDAEKAGTVEGDLQGLAKILNFLFDDDVD